MFAYHLDQLAAGVPAISMSAEEGPEYVGLLDPVVAIDNTDSSNSTRELTHWPLTETGPNVDLVQPYHVADDAG